MKSQRVGCAQQKALKFFGAEFAVEVVRHAERHELLLYCLRRAVASGKQRKIREAQDRLLRDYSSKLISLVRSIDKNGKVTVESLKAMAAGLSAFSDCGEEVLVKPKAKSSGAGWRPLCRFGLKRTALQTLCVDIIAAKFGDDPDDYLIKGRGADRASDWIVDRIEKEDSQSLVVGDIKNFFPSINWEWIADATGLPPQVVKHCLIISDEAALKPCLPLPENTTFPSFAGTVRHKVPQGSRASNVIASLVLGPTLRSLVTHDRLAYYGDDFAIVVDSNEEGQALTIALHEIFQSHPAGPFQLKRCEVVRATAGFSFLSYHHRFELDTGKVWRRPSGSSYRNYERRVIEIARDYSGKEAVRRVARYRFNWIRAFPRWKWTTFSKTLLWLTTHDAFEVGLKMKV